MNTDDLSGAAQSPASDVPPTAAQWVNPVVFFKPGESRNPAYKDFRPQKIDTPSEARMKAASNVDPKELSAPESASSSVTSQPTPAPPESLVEESVTKASTESNTKSEPENPESSTPSSSEWQTSHGWPMPSAQEVLPTND